MHQGAESTVSRWPQIIACITFVLPLCAPFSALGGDGSAPLRVLAHENFRPLQDSAGSAKPASGSLRTLKFDAFGRRFTLALEPNRRLMPDYSVDQGPALSLYRGTLENVPGSWVRLSARAQEIRGAIWDGQELYLVDSGAVAGVRNKTGDPIIFRLADTEVVGTGAFCGDSPASTPISGRHAYDQMLGELKQSPLIQQAAGADARLEISALADSLYRNRYTSDAQARDELLARMNIVDGIYSSQLQVEIQVPTINMADAVAAQLSATLVPKDLVANLGELRRTTPVLRARGLTHLLTGRSLEGDTVGIAYTDSLCSAQYGAGLTQVSNSITIDALVAAHEIGHNFGAPHDGEKACVSTPQGQFLMSPSVSLNAMSFSQCSLDQMRPRLQAASCIMPLAAPDLMIPADLGTSRHAVGQPFPWALEVSNGGGSTAYSSTATLWMPPVVTVHDAFVTGGTCASGAGRVTCQLGDIPATGVRVLNLSLSSDTVGSNSIAARVNATGDAQSGNNVGDGTLVIESEVDLTLVSQAPQSVLAGSVLDTGFVVTNTSSLAVDGVQVTFTLTGPASIASAEAEGASCTLAGASAHCSLAPMAGGQSIAGSLRLSPTSAGTVILRAVATGNFIDPAQANNTIEHSIVVTTAEVAPSTAPVRSGGGAGSGLLYLLLASLAVLRGIVRSPAR